MLVFKIIESGKSVYESIIKYSFIFCLVGIPAGILLGQDEIIIISTLLCMLLIGAWIILRQTGFLIRYNIIGKLSLDENSIIVSLREASDEIVEVKANFRITINYRGFIGLWIGRSLCYGDENEIIYEINQQKKRIKFLIENKEQVEILKMLMKSWYKSKVIIKESGLVGEGTLLLSSNLNFKELQKSKQDLGII